MMRALEALRRLFAADMVEVPPIVDESGDGSVEFARTMRRHRLQHEALALKIEAAMQKNSDRGDRLRRRRAAILQQLRDETP